MIGVLLVIAVSFALLGAVLAVFAMTYKRILVGLVLQSLSLGAAMLVLGAEYYGMLTIVAFLVSDIALYLFLKSKNLTVTNEGPPELKDRLYRSALVWGGIMVFGLGLSLIYEFRNNLLLSSGAEQPVMILEAGVWQSSPSILAAVSVLFFVFVTGGFLLVKKD